MLPYLWLSDNGRPDYTLLLISEGVAVRATLRQSKDGKSVPMQNRQMDIL